MDSLTASDFALALAMAVGAALYSSVGHAGASAYLALMALFGVTPAVMKPTALVLNLIVATLASGRYIRAGLFRWRTLWPFAIGALPMAFVGGSVPVDPQVYRPLVGAVLLVSAARLLWPRPLRAAEHWRDPPVPLAVAAGAALGLLAGLTGTGGGIFLSPLLLFAGWSRPRPTMGVAAVFILMNSASGLLGALSALPALPPALPLYALAVVAGALGGTAMGIRYATPRLLQTLGVVLIVAGAKLIGVPWAVTASSIVTR